MPYVVLIVVIYLVLLFCAGVWGHGWALEVQSCSTYAVIEYLVIAGLIVAWLVFIFLHIMRTGRYTMLLKEDRSLVPESRVMERWAFVYFLVLAVGCFCCIYWGGWLPGGLSGLLECVRCIN